MAASSVLQCRMESLFFVPVCGGNGDYGRKIGKIIPYYGNTMDCACVELRTFAA